MIIDIGCMIRGYALGRTVMDEAVAFKVSGYAVMFEHTLYFI